VFQLPGNFQVNFVEAKGLCIMNMKCPVWDYEYPQHKVLHGFFPHALSRILHMVLQAMLPSICWAVDSWNLQEQAMNYLLGLFSVTAGFCSY
jgi:hypothetical protein